MDDRFATILGYTEFELKQYFHSWIEKWAKDIGKNIKFEDIIDEVVGVYPKVMTEGVVRLSYNEPVQISEHPAFFM
jgi:hypothetical protein